MKILIDKQIILENMDDIKLPPLKKNIFKRLSDGISGVFNRHVEKRVQRILDKDKKNKTQDKQIINSQKVHKKKHVPKQYEPFERYA